MLYFSCMDIIVEFNDAAFDHGIKKEDKMPRMTVEEARAFNEDFINSKFTLGPNGSGFLSQREIRNLGLQNMTVQYLFTKANELHKTPAQIIDELVSKELAAVI